MMQIISSIIYLNIIMRLISYMHWKNQYINEIN